MHPYVETAYSNSELWIYLILLSAILSVSLSVNKYYNTHSNIHLEDYAPLSGQVEFRVRNKQETVFWATVKEYSNHACKR